MRNPVRPPGTCWRTPVQRPEPRVLASHAGPESRGRDRASDTTGLRRVLHSGRAASTARTRGPIRCRNCDMHHMVDSYATLPRSGCWLAACWGNVKNAMSAAGSKPQLPSTIVRSDEGALVSAAKTGDLGAFEELVNRYEARIFRLTMN